MDFKINISLKNFNPSTVEFYRYLLQDHSNPDSSIKNRIGIPDINEVLQVILKEFKELHNPDTLCGIMNILDLAVQHTLTSATDISEFIENLFRNCALSEGDQIIAFQIVYQLLTALPRDSLKSDSIEQFFQKYALKNIKLQTQLALCRSLLIVKFEVDSLLEIVWKQILIEETYYLLVHYIDPLITKQHIFELAECWELLEKLFSSDTRDDRRLGIFLVRKYLKHCSIECSIEFVTSWHTYITVFENLEEKQSHLILPSLETLQNLNLSDPWIPIILRQILKHHNTLVLRWTVNYLLGNFRNTVLRCNILREFFAATNNTWLYNENDVDSFKLLILDEDYQQKFLEDFAHISWKSVPMHVWLMRMKAVQWTSVESKLIINISMRLRQLQNRQIRTECRNLFITIFRSQINVMPLNDYITFLDAFYSSMDQLSEELLHQLVEKIYSSSRPFISFNLFTILRNRESLRSCEKTLMNAFDKLRPELHQWFAILVVFAFQDSEEKQKFCSRQYGISLPSCKQPDGSCSMLEETMNEFVTKLSWDDISRAVVRKATVDLFSSQPNCVNADNYEKFLDSGGVRTFVNLINSFERNFTTTSAVLDRFFAEFRILIKKIVDIERIVRFLITTANKCDPSFLYKYANEILDIDETNNFLAFNVFNSALEVCNFSNEEARQLLIRGLLFGEPLSGDSRLESEYLSMQKLAQENKGESTHEVRQICLGFLKKLDIVSLEFIKKDLIDKSKKLSEKKPRYFENSKHHRLKLRIAQALSKINQAKPIWNDYYLSAIVEENNQTNVTYIYEFIVATTISESYLLQQLETLTNLSNSCHVSMFAISYLFTLHHRSNENFIKKLISFLMPWTMGAYFNTRLFAQITIYHLLKYDQLNGFQYLRNAVQSSLEESPNAVEKLETDLRYNFPSELCFLDTDPVLYVTIVPEDEHRSCDLKYLSKYKKLEAARMLNLTKRESTKQKENDTLKKPVIEDVQRKMNPDVAYFDKQPVKSKVINSEMIVVASLIDKLPNLGGIARTCEVLGTGNLVLNSTKHAENKDFKNLSMTAEKWIQISEIKPSGLQEFLVRKKAEGYSIVGAEQTAKSINFMDFQFPKKCILLLGHEKEGIPADLIALLDFAVEIPQFGMVRSLNVHVTGALFIYEYCKQHLVIQSK